MSRAIDTRLRKLETRARVYDGTSPLDPEAVRRLSDAELNTMIAAAVDALGGADAAAEAVRETGHHNLVELVRGTSAWGAGSGMILSSAMGSAT